MLTVKAMHQSLAARCVMRYSPVSKYTQTPQQVKYILQGKDGVYLQSEWEAHLPEGGLAAASTEVRDFSIVVIPAFATEIVCCSIA